MTNKDMINRAVFPKYSNANIRSKPDINSTAIVVYRPSSVGTSTGVYETDKQGYKWYEVIMKDGSKRWARNDVIVTSSLDCPFKYGDGAGVLNAIKDNDFETYHILLICRENIDRLKKAGADTSKYDIQLTDVINSYSQRQKELRESKLIKVQTGVNKSYEWLKKKWSDFTGLFGVGAFPVIPVVIGAVVGIGTTILIFYAFRPDYEKSVADLKISKELDIALKSVSPETRKKIIDDINKQLTGAYEAGKKQSTWGGFSGAVKTVGIGVVTFIGAKFLYDNYIKKSK